MSSKDLPVPFMKNAEPMRLAQEPAPASEYEDQPTHSGMGVHDILFMLFRHKWKITSFALVGLCAAAALYLYFPTDYQSEAKLLVRYVVDRSAVDGLDSQIKTPSENGTLINSEVEILKSSDLIRAAAESVGVNRLAQVARIQPTLEKAGEYIEQNLNVSVILNTNIISVIFTSNSPSLPVPILQELVKRYFDKHLEVHRSTDAFNFVAQETADLKKELAKTEAELKALKDNAGIISLAETQSDLSTELGKTQEDLDAAEADLAAQRARVNDLEKSLVLPEANNSKTPAQPVSANALQKYQSLAGQLTYLQQAKTELLSKYTQESPFVKTKAAQIAELEKQRRELESQYPELLDTGVAGSSTGGIQSGRPNIESERAVLAGLESKVGALNARMSNVQARAKAIGDVAPRIEELERKVEVEETNYKHSEASLEKARIDETLDPSRMPNISIVQAPSPPGKVKRDLAKVILGLAGGGLGFGVALALAIELILDRTVKRSVELERQLRIPLLLSIPYISSSRARLCLPDGGETFALAGGERLHEISIADGRGELLKPFCEAIRDRLFVYFEVNNMSYKPKLVAVTSLDENAGSSTLAAGLASALSEVSDGKVLLVDKPVSTKGFYDMLTEFKRSDIDYVVFDLPSLGDTSSTLPLARFMDTMLLVVEAEKSKGSAVKRAYTQLAERTNVSVVLNKARSYGPKWLDTEI